MGTQPDQSNNQQSSRVGLSPAPGANKNANKIVDLDEVLFSRQRSLELVASEPIVSGKLALTVRAAEDVQLTWTSPSSDRPDASPSTTISMKVPSQEYADKTGWAFKAALMTNFITSGAGETSEPLRSEFLQSLMDRGYIVESVSNATLTDASIKLNLAPKVTIADSSLNASLALECEQLNLHRVQILNSKIDFKVQSGEWKSVSISGDKTQFTGELGTTTLDEHCIFNGCCWKANIREGRFLGSDLQDRILDMTAEIQCLPPEVTKDWRQLTPEEVAQRDAILAAARWQDIQTGGWKGTTDRNKEGD